jgi:putative lysine transport system permease protein
MDFFSRIGGIIGKNWLNFLTGLGYTLLLAFVGTIVGLFLGMFLALVRNLKADKKDHLIIKILKIVFSKIALIYIEVFRGTPMMVQAMIIFFGGAAVGLTWDPLICGLVVISLNTAAYMAEIIRAGFNSVDKGQIEASRSLGLGSVSTMVQVVFPQALKNSIPTIGNELIVNIKDSSVLNVIMVSELFFSAKIIAGENYLTLETYVIVAVMYLIVTLICSLILNRVEKHLDYDPHKKLKVVTLDD